MLAELTRSNQQMVGQDPRGCKRKKMRVSKAKDNSGMEDSLIYKSPLNDLDIVKKANPIEWLISGTKR